MFWLLTLAAYFHYIKSPTFSRYVWTFVPFALGLMAKPMLVTLPFVFLLLDYWPLDRLNPKRPKIGLIIEKIPLFIIALASCIVAFIVQKKGGAIPVTENYNFPVRLANAFISYLQYIIKMVWPARLAMFYPHPGQNISISIAAISAIFPRLSFCICEVFRRCISKAWLIFFFVSSFIRGSPVKTSFFLWLRLSFCLRPV